MLNDADGHGGVKASKALKDADALFRRITRDVKAITTAGAKSTGAARRAKTLTLKPANSSTRKKAILQDAKRPKPRR
jgi:hypothetical protein